MRQARRRQVNADTEQQHTGVALSSHPRIRTESRNGVTVWMNTRYWQKQGAERLFRLPRLLDEVPGSTSRSAGRITLWHWQPEDMDGPGLIVRQFVHGGALGRLTGTWFWGTDRMQREMAVSLKAADLDLPTPRVVALRTEQVVGPFHTGYLLTRCIPQTVNLLELCRRLRNGDRTSAGMKHRLARRIADAIGEVHDAGLDHADLNLKNILVQHPGDDPEIYIIDLDKARFLRHLPLEDRLDDLVRLDRSVVKWPASRSSVSLHDRIRVWKRYLERYEDWSASWRTLLRQKETRHGRHALNRR